jgi:protein-L-isoaspartate(D-aspartate) O-methyltransferase
MATPSSTETETAKLRERMVEEVARNRDQFGRPLSDAVMDALGTVPRHDFCPGADLEAAYADDVVRYEADDRGVSTSTVSAPGVIATMLDQAGLAPGMRVLEVGSGGYNAALISQIVGQAGTVVSVDIDPAVIDRARACLDKAGYATVRLAVADGAAGYPAAGPYDRIIVTVTTADIPQGWRDQLKAGGAIVAPLRVRGLTRTIRFNQHGERLVSVGYDVGGFVAGQGGLGYDERVVFLDEAGTGLRVDSHQPIEEAPLREAIATDAVRVWTGAIVTPTDVWNDLEVWIAANAQNTAYLKAAESVRKSGRVNTITGLGSIAVYDSDSIAYLTLRGKPGRPATGKKAEYEIGAAAHGPDAPAMAERLAGLVRDWDRELRDTTARFTIWPRTTPSTRLPAGLVEERPGSRITVDWSDAQAGRTSPK